MNISAVIISFNEEHRLEPALKSLAGLVKETIVVDALSTDATVKIARRYGCRVFERKWTNYADQKNYANGLASQPWILSLDADERVSTELRQELLARALQDPPCAAFSIPAGFTIWAAGSGTRAGIPTVESGFSGARPPAGKANTSTRS